MDDQSIINAILGKRTKVPEYKYNAMNWIFYWSYKKFCSLNIPIGKKTKKEFSEANKHPVIVHFNGPALARPWEHYCSHPFAKKYQRVLQMNYPELRITNPAEPFKDYLLKYIKHKYVDKIEMIIHK